MHVVHLMASPFIGGPERQMLGLAKHLPLSTRSTFLSFHEGGKAQAFLDEASAQGFESAALRNNFPKVGKAIAEIADELRARKVDLVTCSGYKPDILGWRAARRAGVPVVSVSHGWTWATWRVRIYETIDRWVIRRMDAVVAVSEAQAEKVRRAGVASEKNVTIRNAVGAEAFGTPDAAVRKELTDLFPTPPRLIVGAAGRLSPEKGFGDFVEAAALVLKARNDVGFVLLGEGPLRGEIEAKISAKGVGDRFRLAGFRSDIGRLMPNFDAAVLTSYTEGLPVVLLEAMAAGVAVVSTNVGGIPEVIVEGQTGFLIPPGQPAELACRLSNLLADDSRRLRMGEAGSERVRREFSFEKQAAAYQSLFDRLVSQVRA